MGPGLLAQSVMCLTSDPAVASSIQPGPILLWRLNMKYFYGHSPPGDSRRVVVSYKWKYVQEVLVNRLVELAPGKSVIRWTDCLNMTIAVDWDVKNQIKQAQIWASLQKKPVFGICFWIRLQPGCSASVIG